MTQDMPAMDEKGLEALARAYDREDASQRGEPDPWDYDDGNDAERLWRTERIACAVIFRQHGKTHVTDWMRLARCDEDNANWKADAAHIANCSPENIRSLLGAIAAKDTALSEMRAELEQAEGARDHYLSNWNEAAEELARARKALEPFAKYASLPGFDRLPADMPLSPCDGRGYPILRIGVHTLFPIFQQSGADMGIGLPRWRASPRTCRH